MELFIELQKLSIDGKVPSQANKWDAGYDLYSVEDKWIKPGERALVKTGISIAVPEGFYARIAPRSGLAVKYGIDVLAGVIDSSYRGEIGVVLINLANGNEEQSFQIKKGDRIAQLIIERCHNVTFEVVNQLQVTDRGQGAFGSSGK